MTKRIVIIAPYPYGQAPSQRFRFEQYVDGLKDQGIEIQFHPFLNDKTWKILYQEGGAAKKAWGLLGSFRRRFALMFKLRKADTIFIHREASMIGPAIFEWIIAKVLRKKFVYDFDDAIWLPNYSASNAKFHRLKAYGKVRKIMKWADRISAGNQYLADFAAQYNQNVMVIPTTIDMKNRHNIPVDHTQPKPVIGWTGTHTTMHYLDFIVPVIAELEKEHDFEFRVISNEKPDYELKSLNFVPWKKETEIEDLSAIHIGLMPLEDNIWAHGKCGFKALQYMSLGSVAVVSPVGVNPTIVQHEQNGFLCEDANQWRNTLIELLNSPELRAKIGEKGKMTVKNRYSVQANVSNYQKILDV